MGCCGNKRKPFKPNGKVCPRCGWVMHRVHKYDNNKRKVVKYLICSNKSGPNSRACGYRENL